jgi:ribosome-associated toxin RatA of RatAB toxin-antitoxin module
MADKALLFIPDISGFTEFVQHTAIQHSRHIIAEILELLIDNNTTGLQLAEIEGDALFFYKIEQETNIEQIRAQIKRMYIAFHTYLKRFEYEKICQCGACSSVYNLTLKFIVHYGEIEFISIKDSNKPYGSNVIKVHRLLKNEVPISEYALFTQDVDTTTVENSEFQLLANYDFGAINYAYESLSDYKKELPDIPLIPDNVPKHNLYSEEASINMNILELYEIISNFDYRLLWSKGIDKVEYEKNRVNRVGDKHKCLIDKKAINPTTVTKKSEKNQLVYGESTTELPFVKKLNVYYVLTPETDQKTRLRIEVFVNFKPFGVLLKRLMKKNFKKVIPENIKELILLADSGFTTQDFNSEFM